MGKYKNIWIKIGDFQQSELNALPIYDNRYIKVKTRAHDDKASTNISCLNVPEDEIECESLQVNSIDYLLAYEIKINIYYLQVYLNSCAYRIANKQITDYIEYNIFETDWD